MTVRVKRGDDTPSNQPRPLTSATLTRCGSHLPQQQPGDRPAVHHPDRRRGHPRDRHPRRLQRQRRRSGCRRRTESSNTAIVTASSSPPAGSPAPASGAPAGAAALGQPQTAAADGYTAELTVFAYQQPAGRNAPPPGPPGHVWGAADVQVCIKAVPPGSPDATVSIFPWSLVYPDGGVVSSTPGVYDQLPKPEYPTADRQVPTGRCVRGWVLFAVDANRRPAMVEHQSAAGVRDWRVS